MCCRRRGPSVTPPSIAIEAPVLGGPERVRVVLNSSSFVNSSRSFVMSITPTTSRRDEDELIADSAAPERPDSMGRRGCCGSSLGAAATRSVIGFGFFVIGYVS